MSVIIFIIILAVLVFVHELGHFVAAKMSGMRVDEFGFGFPPRLWGIQKGETTYSINAIPFGGFVKIFGEDPDAETQTGPDKHRSFGSKPLWKQIFVLVAGVSCNIIFAWLLLSIGFMSGLPTSKDSYPNETILNPNVTITQVESGGPADKAHIAVGDIVRDVSIKNERVAVTSVEDLQTFISTHGTGEIQLHIGRGDKDKFISVTPALGIIADRPAIGVGLDLIGTISLPIHKAFYEGARLASKLFVAIVIGLGHFFKSLFTGGASLSEVTGPVGIAGLVGDATKLGFAYLLSFAAFISLNLAVINLIPFPALDGGRIFFVFIEWLKGSPIKPAIANGLNAVGFILLILLMIIVTFHDIVKLFH